MSLVQAAANGKIDEVRRLLEKKTNGNLSARIPEAFMWAVLLGHRDIVRLLLENGADVNLQNETGESALLFAVEKGNLDISRLLLEHGAKVDLEDNFGLTPLILATRKRNLDLVRLLLEHGAVINLPTGMAPVL